MVFGYGLGTATRGAPLYVHHREPGCALLSDALNAEAREQLRALGAPALETRCCASTAISFRVIPGRR